MILLGLIFMALGGLIAGYIYSRGASDRWAGVIVGALLFIIGVTFITG